MKDANLLPVVVTFTLPRVETLNSCDPVETKLVGNSFRLVKEGCVFLM